MSEDYSSVDRLGADEGPSIFGASIVRRPNARCLGQQFILSRAERSHWRDKVSSVSDAEKREHTCPLQEYVRRSTGEIVVNISRIYLSRAERSHWRRQGFVSVSDAEKQKHSYPIEECVCCLRCEIVRISWDIVRRHGATLYAKTE